MESREQAEQAAVKWIAQRESGPWADADAAAFEAWLCASMTRRVAYYRFRKTWREAGRLEALKGAGAMPGRPLSDVFSALEPQPPRRGAGVMRYAVAACAVLAVAAALFVFRGEVAGTEQYRTPVGGLTTVPMADGSRVTLNTDSRMRIAVNDHERRVELERGEAFFQVARDPARPFVVVAGEKRIVAVGTEFSVRREGEDIRVSVTEGAVRLLARGADTPPKVAAGPDAAGREPGVLLSAGAIAEAESAAVLVRRQPVAELEQQLTWRTGVLTFRDTPLVEAVAEFNRYNPRKIFIEDPAIATIGIGGLFRSTDLDPFLRLIEEGLAIRVTRDRDRIVLSAR